ncbi:U32 family peptidase [Aliikangiella coralliicola]|uniref:Ubiquinone biosynthesis protein UbiV n=2 Tax=Aliikangiella coralliicola TaxID=2592383 RepID=A0A545U550_9GAMM|nr:U32 family peptidase [Aliikangiella coralliicola]
MKISVASVPYFWSKEAYGAFYSALSQTPVDIVYLGETVCSKRRSMKFSDWIEIAEVLRDSGKQVVLSTLTLLEAESELKYLTKIARQKDFLIEANDMAAVQVASENGNSFVTGCAINVYNNQSFSRLSRLGMKRWCVPVELGQRDIIPMVSLADKLGVEVEYQVFGRMPLAYSARCFTARHHQLDKDNCQFKCLNDEQGILVKTQDGDSFAQINGIQTQSAKVSNLINRWSELKEAKIDIARIVPVSAEDTLQAVDVLSNSINKKTQSSSTYLAQDYEFCNGYWLQIEGMKFVS